MIAGNKFMIIKDSFDNKGLIIAYVMIDVGQDLLRQHLTNILKGEKFIDWLNSVYIMVKKEII